tara:strand:- start:7127 stop:8230 length:1104 start_codon:yes stop_codon:yes gene_type:complete
MKVAVTGSNGFIGKNLCFFLHEKGYEVLKIQRNTSKNELESIISKSEFIFHLAGINRPKNDSDFHEGNVEFTKAITQLLLNNNKTTPILFSSSSQAAIDNEYGKSKLAAEKILENYSKTTGALCYIYRLPNVFGKWCKPDYNSFIATFCHNVMHDKELFINDPSAKVTMVYIDDVCLSFADLLETKSESGFYSIKNQYESTVGEIAKIITSFKDFKNTLVIENVGVGLKRALYSTFLSYTDPKDFSYPISSNEDKRGIFCEMMKTKDSGQFSFFTALPGITRGGHYHHSKNEKFLVIKGKALFKFENISTGDSHLINVDANKLELVDTIPGWTHDITNIGDEDLIVMLWANEIFDHDKPDTYARELF